jgi:hypothetical protein
MTTPKKSPFLIISGSAYMRGILKFVLETLLHTDVTELSSEEKALQFLREVPDQPSMIVYDYTSDAYLIEDFVAYLKDHSKNVQIVVLVNKLRPEAVEEFQKYPQFTLIDESEIPKGLVAEAIKTFGDTEYMNESPYCRIDIDFLSILDGINKNLFIKIGTDKFIKVFNENDNTDLIDIKKYRAKGINYLYLNRETALWVIDQIQRQIDVFLKSNNFRFILRGANESAAKRFQQKIIRINQEVHVDKEFQETISKAVDRIRGIVEKDPPVSTYIKTLKQNENKYALFTQKMNLVSLISCMLAKKLDWISKVTLDKLVYAAVISDITLAVRPELLSIGSFSEFRRLKPTLSPEDQELYLSHPADAANLLKKYFPGAPPDTDSLAMQHHELPDGSGFPLALKADKISPLSALFIVASDFSFYYLMDDDPSLDDYFLKTQGKYDYMNFRKVLKALETIKRI